MRKRSTTEACRPVGPSSTCVQEADIAEVVVLTPDGDRHSIDGIEPGYKRIPRANLPRSPQTAGNANVLQSRSTAASFPLLDTASTDACPGFRRIACNLRDDPVAWLINPHHNTGRRRQFEITLISSLLSVHLLPCQVSLPVRTKTHRVAQLEMP